MEKLSARIVQPNFDPYDKGPSTRSDRRLQLISGMIKEPGLDSIDLVVLPEAVVPGYIFGNCLREHANFQPLWHISYTDEVAILAGYHELKYHLPGMSNKSLSVHPYYSQYNRRLGACESLPDGFFSIYNSSVLILKDSFPQNNPKRKLIPFIETLPFLKTIGRIDDFLPGDCEKCIGV